MRLRFSPSLLLLAAIGCSAGTAGAPGKDGAPGQDGAQGARGPQGLVGVQTLVRTRKLPAGDEVCPSGGVRTEVGLDADGDGSLSDGEVHATLTQSVCNGAEGLSPLVATSTLIAGEAGCVTGGVRIDVGVDTDRNGQLGPGEIDEAASRVVCHGEQGQQGQTGASGLNALLALTDLLPGDAHCPTGGVQIDVGVDRDGNGLLDALEVDATRVRFLCHGLTGLKGDTGEKGPKGETGDTGAKGDKGETGDRGDTGLKGDAGEKGATGDTGPKGDKGETGDKGATGEKGTAGDKGATGANGYNALVSTTSLSTGDANCPAGGVRLDVGVDLDRDGVLDSDEITSAQTRYVCNGAAPSSYSSMDIVSSTTRSTSPSQSLLRVRNTSSSNDLLKLSSTGDLFLGSEDGHSALLYQASNGAFRMGYYSTLPTSLADQSVAFGYLPTATGSRSFAFSGTASGTGAIALGSSAQATGDDSLALGPSALASGLASAAIGPSIATGSFGYAMGLQTKASGNFSLALGKNADTNGYSGAIVISDASAQFSSDAAKATANNQFTLRAAGGIRMMTNMGLTTGCTIAAGGGTWECTSDRNAKKDFEPVDGEEVLKKVARLPIQSWRYRTEENGARHIGPVAQDFHAAFGVGSSDRSIGMADADGVNMIAIQALAKRTEEVKELRSELAELRGRLDALERRSNRRR